MIAPMDESSELVMQWIESEGLGDYATMSPRWDSVVVEASISQIEQLLNAEYTPFGKLPL
jgi:tripeptidyl-peptidase-1